MLGLTVGGTTVGILVLLIIAVLFLQNFLAPKFLPGEKVVVLDGPLQDVSGVVVQNKTHLLPVYIINVHGIRFAVGAYNLELESTREGLKG